MFGISKKEKDIIVLGEDIYSKIKIDEEILIAINSGNYNLANQKAREKDPITIIQVYRLIVQNIFTNSRSKKFIQDENLYEEKNMYLFLANQYAKKYNLPKLYIHGLFLDRENISESLYYALKYNLNLKLNGNVLDVGCRDGRYLDTIKKLGAQNIYAVEPNIEEISKAKKLNLISKDNFFECKVEEIPKKYNEFFDYIIIFNIPISYIDLGKVKLLLKKNGKILITFTSYEEIEMFQKSIQNFNFKCLTPHYFDILFEPYKNYRTNNDVNKFVMFLEKREYL